MANNRVVVSQSGSVEQINHYYPYGALFAESTNGDVQRFKYNGKELDRNFGLNWYDHGARHNDAEKYYGISPYAYCGGDPVNLGDYDGMGWITATYNQETWYCFDPRIKSQEDINKYYYYGDDINDKNISYLGETSEVIHNNNTFVFFHDDGSYSYFSASSCAAKETTEIDEAGLHIGKVYPNGESGEIETNKNLFGVYLGQFNPKDNNQKDSYCIPPIDWLDYAAYCHDKGYDKVGAKGIIGVLFNTKTVDADSNLSKSSAKTSVQCLPRLSHYYLRRTLLQVERAFYFTICQLINLSLTKFHTIFKTILYCNNSELNDDN